MYRYYCHLSYKRTIPFNSVKKGLLARVTVLEHGFRPNGLDGINNDRKEFFTQNRTVIASYLAIIIRGFLGTPSLPLVGLVLRMGEKDMLSNPL